MDHGLIFSVSTSAAEPRLAGPHRIASHLRSLGMDIEVIDFAYFWTLKELQELARSRVTDHTIFFGFGHIFGAWNDILEQFCHWIKKNYPRICIVSGGATKPMFHSTAIDYYVQGYGENAIVEILKYASGNGPRPIFEIGSKKIVTIDTYPSYPMRSLLTLYQDRDFLKPNEWLSIEFSRGCKFECAFCNFPILGVKGDYTRDADDFELQVRNTYDQFGITNYTVSDETFNARTEKITKFADVVERLPFDPWFTAYIRADLLVSRPRDQEELLRMNVLGHFYGVESFNTKTAKIVGKGMESARLKQGLIDVKKYFETHGRQLYRGTISLIIGLPEESIDVARQSKQWLLGNWQGQSFMINPLDIPKEEYQKPSLITMDYKKYGYQEITNMDGHVLAVRPQMSKFDLTTMMDTCFWWKNKHMDRVQAAEISAEFIQLKREFDFRLDCFAISERHTNAKTIEEKLELRHGYAVIDNTWQWYINKKLSI
jgi:hypothetical protein